MGIFNNTKSLKSETSASKVNFGIILADYATKQQFKILDREMESYLHKNKELNNSMNRSLDMSGNRINNLGNPEKPTDAVPKQYVLGKYNLLLKTMVWMKLTT